MTYFSFVSMVKNYLMTLQVKSMLHPSVKFRAEYSKQEVNSLDLNIKLDGELKTDFFVKPKDTPQFLDPTSSHPYHCKKGIPYSKA